jgi:hypothetical protein
MKRSAVLRELWKRMPLIELYPAWDPFMRDWFVEDLQRQLVDLILHGCVLEASLALAGLRREDEGGRRQHGEAVVSGARGASAHGIRQPVGVPTPEVDGHGRRP